MKTIKLLDVSLRDGGHRTNFCFSLAELEGMLIPLDNSGIDYIEIGYRNGFLQSSSNLGWAGMCKKDYLLSCHKLVSRAKIAVMIHPTHVDLQDLRELKEHGVSLLRICVLKGKLEAAYPVIEWAQQLGLMVSINFTHMSYYTLSELDDVVDKVSGYQPDMIYFADSNGSLFPADIHKIYESYTSQSGIAFGFHAHDNLGLAQANVLAAMNAGVDFIDAALAGMGKGTGNLKTEFFIAYLQALGRVEYQLDEVLRASNFVRNALKIGHEEIEMDEFVRGIRDLSTADLKALKPLSAPSPIRERREKKKKILAIAPVLPQKEDIESLAKSLSFLQPEYEIDFIDPLSMEDTPSLESYYSLWKTYLKNQLDSYDALFGFSFGGVILQQCFSLFHSKKLPIVLFSTPTVADTALRQKLTEVITLCEDNKIVEAINSLYQHVVYQDYIPRQCFAGNHTETAERLIQGLNRVLATDSTEIVTTATVNHLHLIGASSKLVNKDNVISPKTGQLISVPDAGMRILEDNPDYCQKKILEMLTSGE